MSVREAARKAKDFVKVLYVDEPIGEVGVEEVSPDEIGEAKGSEKVWAVTIGFVRLWDRQPSGGERLPRHYKTVSVRDSDAEVLALRDRSPAGDQSASGVSYRIRPAE